MAVYTDVSDEDLEAFIAEYSIGDVESCKGIAEGVENSNYLLQTTTGPFILTLYEKRVNPDDLPFFLNLLDHLAGRGVKCPTPIHGQDGRALRELCGRPAAITSFLRGMWPKRILPHHTAELGKAMADLHSAGADFPMSRANDLSVEGWRPLFDRCADAADTVRPGLRDTIAKELDVLEARWPKDLPSGVIHADLFPDNVFFLGTQCSGLIDFYFACTDSFAYDIAICLNAWCFEPDGQFNITKARNLLLSYSRRRSVSREELEALPILCRGAAMRFLLTRLYDWVNTPEGAMVKRKDPGEYLHKLVFHQQVPNAAAYGLDPADVA